MLKFASLGSGSKGNATIIESETTRLLVDCGFAARELNSRLTQLCSSEASSLDGILVTHEHGDHSKGVGALSRKYNLAVWSTAGTYRHAKFGKLSQYQQITPNQPAFYIGDIQVIPFPVPHDAQETVQFVFRCGEHCLGVLTDLGMITPHIVQLFKQCNAVLLEANHDVELLAKGPYPRSLQVRVGGDYGHLNNRQATDFLSQLNHQQLQHVVVAHLSEKNNDPLLVRQCFDAVLASHKDKLTLLQQDKVSEWFEWQV